MFVGFSASWASILYSLPGLPAVPGNMAVETLAYICTHKTQILPAKLLYPVPGTLSDSNFILYSKVKLLIVIYLYVSILPGYVDAALIVSFGATTRRKKR